MKRETLHKGFLTVEKITYDGGITREIIRASNSVNLLIFDRSNDEVILVQQRREPMLSVHNPTGMIIETVAGRFDVNLGAQQLAAKEAFEEAGIEIDPWDIELLNNGKPMALSAGVLTECAYLCFVEIDESNKRQSGNFFGTDPGEHTEPVRIPVVALDRIDFQDVRVFALVQYLLRKLEQEQRG